MKKDDIIKLLHMNRHIEGGYFSETYKSSLSLETDRTGGKRHLMTSMYYLMTDDQPIGYFHCNKSDILCYFHSGSPITYLFITHDGRLEKKVLGNDVSKGESPQLLKRGGAWHASVLESGEYGLLSEVVAPGFDYSDMTLADENTLHALCPNLWNDIAKYVK